VVDPVCGSAGACSTGTSIGYNSGAGTLPGATPSSTDPGTPPPVTTSTEILVLACGINTSRAPSSITEGNYLVTPIVAPEVLPVTGTPNPGPLTFVNEDSTASVWFCYTDNASTVVDPVCGSAGACSTGTSIGYNSGAGTLPGATPSSTDPGTPPTPSAGEGTEILILACGINTSRPSSSVTEANFPAE
jgi:hypothetical protein